MTDWKWVSTRAALAAHREQLAEHGGGDGIRDAGMFESAMARPQNLAAYGRPDLAALAASYAFGLARNHPFIDGNKRTAAVVCEGFLGKNGSLLNASNAELVPIFLALAAGELSEEELARWLREHIAASEPERDRR
jgi:death-on-curing protein